MPRRIIRTTRKTQYNEDGEPIETVVSQQEQQPIDPLTDAETTYEPVQGQQRVTYTYRPPNQPVQETQVYEPERGIQRVTYTYPTPAPTVQQTEIVEPQWSRTLRRVTDRQVQVLRNLDMRVSNLETVDDQGSSFERQTWWALWGILMLILGAALVVILMLIFTGLPH